MTFYVDQFFIHVFFLYVSLNCWKHYVPMFLCSLCNFACVIDTETVQRLLRHKWRIYALELVLQIWQYSDEFFSKMNTLNEFSKTHDLTRSFFHARKSQDSIFPGKFLIYQLEHHTSNGYDSLLYNKLCFYWRLLAKRRNPCSISFFFFMYFWRTYFATKVKKITANLLSLNKVCSWAPSWVRDSQPSRIEDALPPSHHKYKLHIQYDKQGDGKADEV